MAKAGQTQKKPVVLADAPKGASTKNKERGVWQWLEREKGKIWESALIPEGDVCVASVKRSFSKELDGTFKFYGYRSGRILGRRETFEEARALAESGKFDERKDAVYEYVKNHSGDVPMFLRLTDDERRQVREHYKYDAPRQSDLVKYARERGDEGIKDPSTRKFLAELAKQKPEAGGAGTKKAPAEKREAPSEFDPAGVLSRVRDGNPKKEGSAAFKRWALMFRHCELGSSMSEFLKDGGNPETLRNAVIKGWASVGGKK